MNEGYDEAYSRNGGLFGESPETILVRCIDDLDQTRPVLDVGCEVERFLRLAGRRG